MAFVFAAFVTCVTQARATVYNWSYQDASNSGSGTLTTADASSPSPYVTIEFMSGVFNGLSISTLLDPGFCCGPLSNDNYLYTSGGRCSTDTVWPSIHLQVMGRTTITTALPLLTMTAMP